MPSLGRLRAIRHSTRRLRICHVTARTAATGMARRHGKSFHSGAATARHDSAATAAFQYGSSAPHQPQAAAGPVNTLPRPCLRLAGCQPL